MQLLVLTSLTASLGDLFPWSRNIAYVESTTRQCNHSISYLGSDPQYAEFWQNIYTSIITNNDNIWNANNKVFIDWFVENNTVKLCTEADLISSDTLNVQQYVYNVNFSTRCDGDSTPSTSTATTVTTNQSQTLFQNFPYDPIACNKTSTYPTDGIFHVCFCVVAEFPVNFMGFGWIQGFSLFDSNIINSCETTCGGANQCLKAYQAHALQFDDTVLTENDLILSTFQTANGASINGPHYCSNVSECLFYFEDSTNHPSFAAEFTNNDDEFNTVFECNFITVPNSTHVDDVSCSKSPCRDIEPYFPKSVVESNFKSSDIATLPAPLPENIKEKVHSQTLNALSDYFLCDCTEFTSDKYFNFEKSFYVQANFTETPKYYNPHYSTEDQLQSPLIHCDGKICNITSITFKKLPREWGPLPDTHTDTNPFIWLGSTITGPLGVRVYSEEEGFVDYPNQEALDVDYHVRMPNRTQCFNDPECKIVSTVDGFGTCAWSCIDMDIPVLFSQNFSFYAPPRIRRYDYLSSTECDTPEIPPARKLAFVNTAWLPWLYNIPSLSGNSRFVPWRDGSIDKLQSVKRTNSIVIPEYGCGGVVESANIFLIARNRSDYTETFESDYHCTDPMFETIVDHVVQNDKLQLFPSIVGVETNENANSVDEAVEWLETVYTKKAFGLEPSILVINCNDTHNISLSVEPVPASSSDSSWSNCNPLYCTSRVHHSECSQIPSSNNCSSIPLCEPCTNSMDTTTTIYVPTITYPPTPGQAKNPKTEHEIEVAIISLSVIGGLVFITLIVAGRILYNRQKRGEDLESAPLLPGIN